VRTSFITASAFIISLVGVIACSSAGPASSATAPMAPTASPVETTVPASPTALVVATTSPPATQTPAIATSTPVPPTVVAPTVSPVRPTSTTVPATATPTSAVKLTADQIAATAVAESIGEQCVATPPKPAKGFIGDPARGKVLFVQRGCSACHGAQAQGDVGPKLAGTTLSFEAVLHQLREPRGVMQRYLPSDQSDADECDVYLYVKSLKS
jgi:mono/diheme cytochrome c family protein